MLSVVTKTNMQDNDGTVSWSQIFNAVDSRWFEITGRNLNEDQREYMRLKLVGESSSDENVKFDQLFKASPERGRKFSFWHWIQEALKAANKSILRDLANAGVFPGFMERQKAHQVLEMAPTEGAFIIRFSDTLPGHVAIHFRAQRDSPVRSIDPQDFNPLQHDFGRKLKQFLFNEPLLKSVYCASGKGFSWEDKTIHFYVHCDRNAPKGYDLRFVPFINKLFWRKTANNS